MARVTARHAFTRSKARRQTGRAETNRSIIEARRRYVRQLAEVGIQVEGGSQPRQAFQASNGGVGPVPRGRGRGGRPDASAGTKKITDYFSKTRSLEFSPKVKQPLRTSSSFDPNGVECVTIIDSDNESLDGNNNTANDPTVPKTSNSNHSLGSEGSSIWDSSSDSGNSSSSGAQLMQTKEDIKPRIVKLDINNLGVSFEDLQVKVRVDEDVEIVDMLPPIPLRNHEVFVLDDEEEEENDHDRSLR